jgi:5-formyltetrahydrofolate cyclo-ligase
MQPPISPEENLDTADDATPAESTRALKSDLRLAAIERREAISAAQRSEAAQFIAQRGLPAELGVHAGPGVIVSGYSPLRSELSPVPLMRRCAESGAILALPVVIGRGQPLAMRIWSFGAPLKTGVWGICEPSAQAETVFPDILIVPLLAFDRNGQRIGYGAGYYDMTITRLRTIKPVIAIGLALAAQEIATVPATVQDARLDIVLTEREVIDCRA